MSEVLGKTTFQRKWVTDTNVLQKRGKALANPLECDKVYKLEQGISALMFLFGSINPNHRCF